MAFALNMGDFGHIVVLQKYVFV